MKINPKIIPIKKSHWDKINRVFTKLYEHADHLHSLFRKDDKIYKELGRYAEEVRGLLGNAEITKAETKLAQIWEQGFRVGVAFVDEELGDCISDKLDQFAEQGYMPNGQRFSSYDWEQALTKQIKQGQKSWGQPRKCHYCPNYGCLGLGGLNICPAHESRFHEDYRWNKPGKCWEHIFDLLIEKDGEQYNLYPKGWQEAKSTWSSDLEADEPEITLTAGEEKKLGNLTALIQDNYLYLGSAKYQLAQHPHYQGYYGIELSPSNLQILQDYCSQEEVRIQ